MERSKKFYTIHRELGGKLKVHTWEPKDVFLTLGPGSSDMPLSCKLTVPVNAWAMLYNDKAEAKRDLKIIEATEKKLREAEQ